MQRTMSVFYSESRWITFNSTLAFHSPLSLTPTLLLHNILNLLGLPLLGILWMKPLPSLPSLIPGSFPLRGRTIVTSCLDLFHWQPLFLSLPQKSSNSIDVVCICRCSLCPTLSTVQATPLIRTFGTDTITIESPISPGPNKPALAPPAGQFGDAYFHTSSPSNLAPLTFALKAVSSNGFPLDPLTNTGRHICIHHLLPSIVASPLILPSSPLIVVRSRAARPAKQKR